MEYKFLKTRGSVATIGRPISFGIKPGTPLSELDIPESVIELMPESVAREEFCMPLRQQEDTLLVAHDVVNDVMCQDKLRFILNRNVQFYESPRTEIVEAINEHYGKITGESADSILQEFSDASVDFTESTSIGALRSEGNRRTRNSKSPRHVSSHGAFERKPKRISGQRVGQRAFESNSTNGGDGMFYYTVKEGQKVAVHRFGGEIEVVEGPRRIWKGWSEFAPMRHYVAHPGEFLVVRFIDGGQDHIKGPAEIWKDPKLHESIEVQDTLTLAAKEAVVVYGETPSGETKQRIVFGPGIFMPRPGEWLHRFSWHSSSGGSRGVEKQPNGLQFQKLWLMPDQMYHDVNDVRTADDAVLVIRLMIFFELVDIEKMLDTTHDPIGDFINAATSDVVEFTGKRSFEDFKQQTEQLNDISTYSQLLHRAEQCGYKINNVVYRGYGAPDSLQKMHDEAIAARTSLQLEKDTETQTQELEDYRLQCQLDRANRRREEQANEVEHDILLQEKRTEAELKGKLQKQTFAREQNQKDLEMKSEIQRLTDEQKRAHLSQLKSLGVELTEYLTQGRADQVIEVRGRGGNSPHLHLEQNGRSPRAKKV